MAAREVVIREKEASLDKQLSDLDSARGKLRQDRLALDKEEADVIQRSKAVSALFEKTMTCLKETKSTFETVNFYLDLMAVKRAEEARGKALQ